MATAGLWVSVRKGVTVVTRLCVCVCVLKHETFPSPILFRTYVKNILKSYGVLFDFRKVLEY